MIRQSMARLALAVVVSCFLSAVVCTPEDRAGDLLEVVSEKYESLNNYLFEGVESANVPGTDCNIEIPFQIVQRADSADASTSPQSPTIRFTTPKLTKVCFDAIRNLGGFSSPGQWDEFDHLQQGARAARVMSMQILNLNGEDIQCAVVEVVYDPYLQKIRGLAGPIRYWIDETTLLVRRVEFTEVIGKETRPWSVTIEKVSLGAVAPPWFRPSETVSYPHPAPLGAPAPDFSLRTADGQLVHLKDLRGKTVLLDFWATWCMACDEEIPFFEELQSRPRASGVVLLGVSDEKTSVVREWLQQNHRSFRTLVDAKQAFRAYGVGPIPVLVVINQQGVVSNYISGFTSERRLRNSLKDIFNDPN